MTEAELIVDALAVHPAVVFGVAGKVLRARYELVEGVDVPAAGVDVLDLIEAEPLLVAGVAGKAGVDGAEAAGGLLNLLGDREAQLFMPRRHLDLGRVFAAAEVFFEQMDSTVNWTSVCAAQQDNSPALIADEKGILGELILHLRQARGQAADGADEDLLPFCRGGLADDGQPGPGRFAQVLLQQLRRALLGGRGLFRKHDAVPGTPLAGQ